MTALQAPRFRAKSELEQNAMANVVPRVGFVEAMTALRTI